ncbi:MAG: cytidylate kinase [Frankiales bacterium]|nr:cytidylate kinase [Frankiales bacterium]
MSTGATRIVALDGPSGSGKSTVARKVAARLGWRYVDTGASYRAATLAALRAGVDLDDADAVLASVRTARIELSTDPEQPGTWLDGEDISDAIRGPEVTSAVSAVSAVPAVRAHLVELQRVLAGRDGAVLEGRDIATAVMPDAQVKVYLDASPQVRASRRAAEQHAGVTPGGSPASLVSTVAEDLARRDRLDSSRAADPLRPSPDAVHLDSSQLDAAAVVDLVLDLARDAGLVS